MNLIGHYTYFVTFILLVAGLFIVIARGNLIKKLIGLGIFQTSVYLLYRSGEAGWGLGACFQK